MNEIKCPKCNKIIGEVENLEAAKAVGFKLKIRCKNNKCKHMCEL